VLKYNVTLLNNLMEMDAAGMKTFIPAERFVPTKCYLSVWICMNAILLGRQGTNFTKYLLGIKRILTS
jgi:hypothetical protein